jgi:hypothetical protein
VNADSPGWESPARAGDVAAARADGSPKRAVPLIPDPSGRPGLQSPHLLVIDREQGIDGCHTVTLRARNCFSAALAVAISAMAQPALLEDFLTSTGRDLTPSCNPHH